MCSSNRGDRGPVVRLPASVLVATARRLRSQQTRRLRPPAQDARLTRREYARRRNGRPQSYAHAGASRAGGSSPSRPQRAWTLRRPGASGLTMTSMTATITIVSKRPTRSARPRNPSTSGGSPLRQSGQASVVRLKMRIVDLDVPLPAPDRAPESVIELLRRGGAGRGRGHAERHRSEQQDPSETGHAKLRLAS